jgi:hypothetical protein
MKSLKDYVINEAKQKFSDGNTFAEIMKCKAGTILFLVEQYVFALPNVGKVKVQKLEDVAYELVKIGKYNTETDAMLTIRSNDNKTYTIFGEQTDISGFSVAGLSTVTFKMKDKTTWCSTTDKMISKDDKWLRVKDNEVIVSPYTFYGDKLIVDLPWLISHLEKSSWGGIIKK